jgi:hypothetical protein
MGRQVGEIMPAVMEKSAANVPWATLLQSPNMWAIMCAYFTIERLQECGSQAFQTEAETPLLLRVISGTLPPHFRMSA